MLSDVIYTEKNECQECCKCVRNCPVKAIKIVNHSAHIDHSRCIACGTCVEVCPAGAQRVRNDVSRVKFLLKLKKKVILSLAPSFVAIFENPDELLKKIKKIGFFAVSETALGADIVSYFQKKLMSKERKTVFSTACPVVVNYIQKYHAEYVPYLSPYLSPLLAHCMFLKEFYGEDVGIVFAGPCIAKKNESDLYPDYLDVALTFEELDELLKEVNVAPEDEEVHFEPFKSVSGVIYPIEGGLSQTLTEYENRDSSVIDTEHFTLSNLKEIMALLDNENFDEIPNTFCEFLACEGGCINGSALKEKGNIISKKRKVVEYYKQMKDKKDSVKAFEPSTFEKIPLYDRKFSEPLEKQRFSQEERMTVLNKIGIFSKEDMLDCGGCGYNTCEEFAEACLMGLAEYDMCVINMKRLAQNKLNMLIKLLPLGVIMVDSEKKIVEANAEFIKMFVGFEVDEKILQRAKGTKIEKFLKTNIDMIFLNTLKNKEYKALIRSDEKVFEVYSFLVNKDTIGMIFQDVTQTAIRRETIVKKAEEVINRNLQLVQQIAYLLGENASETEVILDSLIEAIKPQSDENGKNS